MVAFTQSVPAKIRKYAFNALKNESTYRISWMSSLRLKDVLNSDEQKALRAVLAKSEADFRDDAGTMADIQAIRKWLDK